MTGLITHKEETWKNVQETEHFCEMLDRLYLRSKKESRSGFLQVKERMDRGEKDG